MLNSFKMGEIDYSLCAKVDGCHVTSIGFASMLIIWFDQIVVQFLNVLMKWMELIAIVRV